MAEAASNDRLTSEAERPPTLKKTLYSVLIVLAVTAAWTGSTQLTKSSLTSPNTFNAPFFLMWFSTTWMSLCFPLAVPLAMLLLKTEGSLGDIWRSSVKVLGQDGLTPKSYVLRLLPFLLFWVGANYCYSRALVYATPSQVSATFSSNLAFVYALSLIFLRDMLSLVKLLAIGISITGIVLMVYSVGEDSAAALGIVLIVVSSLSAAVYKVAFKKLVGDAGPVQVALFMTLIGLSNCFLLWPVVVGLFVSGSEIAVWELIPWGFICGSAALSVAFNFLINFGIAVTHPLYISVGIFLGYPVNAVVDVIVRHYHMKAVEIVGGVLILGGFLLMLIPDIWERKAWRALCPRPGWNTRLPCSTAVAS